MLPDNPVASVKACHHPNHPRQARHKWATSKAGCRRIPCHIHLVHGSVFLHHEFFGTPAPNGNKRKTGIKWVTSASSDGRKSILWTTRNRSFSVMRICWYVQASSTLRYWRRARFSCKSVDLQKARISYCRKAGWFPKPTLMLILAGYEKISLQYLIHIFCRADILYSYFHILNEKSHFF